MQSFKYFFVEQQNKITLSTNPAWFGANGTENYKPTGPVTTISTKQLVGFEPDEKMNQPKSKANVEKIITGLKNNDNIPPILVRKYKTGYQVVDGHHRFWAFKQLGKNSIPAYIVPPEDIIEENKKEKRRLDPKCWKGYRRAGTKLKDGTRVNKCIKVNK
jgi:hypothetical protein